MNILIASSLCPYAIERLRRRHDVVCAFNAPEDELRALIEDCDILVFRSGVDINRHVLSAARRLRLLIRAGSGLDNLDTDFAREAKIRLVRIPQPGADAVAELTFGFMLSLARQIVTADRSMREGQWLKHELTGHLLRGKVLGIVGAGNIGRRVGQMGAAWGMRSIGCVSRPSSRASQRLERRSVTMQSFKTVLRQADFLALHVPLTSATRNLIGTGEIDSMKNGAFVVNMARGGVVDEQALYDALAAGKLAGAAMDVHAREGRGCESPLAEFSNVILTPHIGSCTTDTQRAIGRRVERFVNLVARQNVGKRDVLLSQLVGVGSD